MTDDSDARYEEVVLPLFSLAPKLESLIKELLADAGLNPHSVTARVKSKESVDNKLLAKADRYSDTGDITDLLGVRVITYFSDDVDSVARHIVQEFDVDDENSVDKRQVIAPDRFGYLSLHYVLTLKSSRYALPEYRRFSGIKFEVQIRSILQHAWAEIEHDLGYKAEGVVPRTFRRRFSRLAGLLELADEEFIALRSKKDEYETDVQAKIDSDLGALGLDQATLLAAYKQVRSFTELDESIASVMAGKLGGLSSRYMERRASRLRQLGLDSVSQVVDLVSTKHNYITSFCKAFRDAATARQEFLKRDPDKPLPLGIGLLYLEYVLAANSDESVYATWRENWTHAPTYKRLRSFNEAVAAELGPWRP